MDLNKHIVKDIYDDGSLFHSSGFAKVASGNRLGSTDGMSFEGRRIIEHNRRYVGVGGYQRSAIGQNRIKLPPRNVIKVVPINRQSRPAGVHAINVPARRHIGPF